MKKKLKAILLSAGLGTRLRPQTFHKPKCLMEINNEPILGIWIEKLYNLGCSEILINTHYFSDQVEEFIKNFKKFPINIKTSYEEKLLGTAGTLMNNLDFIEDDTLLIHSDNFTTSNLNGLIKKHNKKNDECLLTMLTFKTETPQNCGVVLTDRNGIVQSFHEKVANPPGNIANGAIYVFNKDLIYWLKSQDDKFVDFSNDVLPLLTGKIQTWQTKEIFIDIGTPNSLKTARNIFSKQKTI